MAIKYTIPMRDDFNTLWRSDIDIPSYQGSPISLTGVGRSAMVAEWNGDTDEPYTPIINSKVTLQFYNESNVDITELQNLQDMEARVLVYRDSTLWWSGYVIPDGIQRNFKASPYPVQLTATDGLALLKDVSFQGVTNWLLPIGIHVRSPLAFIRYVLYNTQNLNIRLPIRWCSSVKSVEYSDDAIAGTTEWGALGEGWTEINGDTRSNMYILENMVKSIGARIFQFGGKWHIERVNDVVGGIYNWKELDTTYSGTERPELTTGTEDIRAGLNPTYYPFVSENHVITMKPALTDVVATYEQYQAENILPNGGFDKINTFSQTPLYWSYWTNPDGRASFGRYENGSITGQSGEAVELTYPLNQNNPMNQDAEFALTGGLPLDANILFKRFTFGFTFMALNGFPYYTSGDSEGQIEWETNPLRIRMLYMCDDGSGNSISYYLNEYGYWQYVPINGYWNILNITSAQIGSNRVFTFSFVGTPLTGNTIELKFFLDGIGSQRMNHVVKAETSGNLMATLEDFFLDASKFPSGIWSFTFSQILYTIEVVATTSLVYHSPSYQIGTGQDSILDDMSIPISVQSMKIGDIANIAFSGKGGNNEILIPDPGILDGGQLPSIGKLYLWFYIKEGQSYVLDDVYIRVEDNNDVYQSINPSATRRSNKQDVSLGISSSFSGFMLSNYMTSYDKSNVDFLFTDGKHTSSMTGLLANAMMRYRYKPSMIFNGSIYTNGRNWKFNHSYLIQTLSGTTFMPLQSKYNIETGIVDLVVMEGRDDDIVLEEKHYGDNEVIN